MARRRLIAFFFVLLLQQSCIFTQARAAAPETWIVIVDGVSSGSLLAPAFQEKARTLGIPVRLAHVKTSPTYLSYFESTYHPEDYDLRFELGENPERRQALVQELARLNPAIVVAGAEIGVVAADELSAQLGLSSSTPELTALKRDKVSLYQYLWNRQLSRAPSAGVSSIIEALSWKKREKVPFPLVAKPVDDAGGHGFRIVRNRAELKSALDALFQERTVFGEKISRVVLQPKLEGNQFAVNGAAFRGAVVFTDVIRYEKTGAVYLKDSIVDPKTPEAASLMGYTRRMLEAIGLRSGNFHVELIDSPRYGLVPIDVAGRAMGGKDHKMVRACTGYTQMMALAEAVLDFPSFEARSRRLDRGLPAYELNRSGYLIDLVSWQEGEVTDLSGLGFLKELQTFSESWISVKRGDRLKRTEDLLGSPGAVLLLGEPRDLERDYRALRNFERRGKLITVARRGFCERMLDAVFPRGPKI